MGTWQLLCNEEVVDPVDLKTNIYEEAHTYFRLRMNLKPEDFNKIFIVKEYVRPRKHIGKVKWWKEESTKLDPYRPEYFRHMLLFSYSACFQCYVFREYQ